MIFLFEFIELLACLTESGLLFWLFGAVFKNERRNSSIYWDWIIVAGISFLTLGINNIVLYSAFTLFEFVFLGSVAAFALYRVSYTKCLSLTMFYTFCFCSTDMLVSNLYLSFGNQWNINADTIMTFSFQRTGLVFLSKSAMIVFIISLKKWVIPVMKSEHERGILLISAIFFLGFLYFREQSQSIFSVELSSIWGLMVIFCVLIIYIGYSYLENQKEKMKNQMMEMKNELLQENYQTVSALYESNAKLYHDLNNHLDILYQMLIPERLSEAREYISQISAPMKELVLRCFTGNDIIDVIISSKMRKAEQFGIQVDIDVNFPVNTGIQPNDVCTIIGNLMDNAIEGSQNVENPKICLKIHQVHQFIIIQISNTISKQPQIDEETGRLITDKADHTRHGWGIQSVKSALEKYNGTIKYQFSETEFKITAMLFF